MGKMSIYLSKGVGNLDFSMSKREVEKNLGSNGKLDDFIYEDQVLYYEDIGLAIIFKLINSNFVISAFEMEKNNFLLWGYSIFKMEYSEVINMFIKQKILDYAEDYYEGTQYIFYKNLCFEFESNMMETLTLHNPEYE